MFTRKKTIAPTDHQQELPGVEIWMVRWTSRHGSFSSNTNPEVEAFTSKEAAQAFKKQLEDAFALIKHTSGNKVTIEKQQQIITKSEV